MSTQEFPVTFEIERPPSFDRTHVFGRIGALIAIGWIVQPVGLLWLGLPVVAAILISQKGGQRYLSEDGPKVTRALNWIVDLVAYIALLTDRLPSREGHAVRFEVERSGSPTTRSALRRIVSAIPSVIILAVLTWFATILWFLAMLRVSATGSYPASWWRFLCGLVGWEARLIAYLASLVDTYPPFSLVTNAVTADPARAPAPQPQRAN
jgi:uncharacterized protein DUF4389